MNCPNTHHILESVDGMKHSPSCQDFANSGLEDHHNTNKIIEEYMNCG